MLETECSWLVAVLFEPLLDLGLTHPDSAADPHRGYGVLGDELICGCPPDTQQFTKLCHGQPLVYYLDGHATSLLITSRHVSGHFLANENRAVACTPSTRSCSKRCY